MVLAISSGAAKITDARSPIIPDDAGRFQRIRVALKAREATGPAPPQAGETWARHVAIGCERVAGGADPEGLPTAGYVALLGGSRGLRSDHRQQQEDKSAH